MLEHVSQSLAPIWIVFKAFAREYKIERAHTYSNIVPASDNIYTGPWHKIDSNIFAAMKQGSSGTVDIPRSNLEDRDVLKKLWESTCAGS